MGEKNESDWLFGLTRNLGLVQRKVTAVNMLIQNDFLKQQGLEKRLFFEPHWRPIRASRQRIASVT
jgi:hypothetical protein